MILDWEGLEEDFFERAVLMGIVTSLPYYQVVRRLNALLRISLLRQHDSEKLVQEQYFPLYTYMDQARFMAYYFYINRSKGHFLLSELRQVDYLLMIKGGFPPGDLPERLRAALPAEQVVVLDIDRLRSRQQLLL